MRHPDYDSWKLSPPPEPKGRRRVEINLMLAIEYNPAEDNAPDIAEKAINIAVNGMSAYGYEVPDFHSDHDEPEPIEE